MVMGIIILLMEMRSNWVAAILQEIASIQEILSIQYHVDTFEVKNNYVHDGGRPNWGGEGIDLKNGASNGLVHHNTVSNVQSTGIYIDAYSLSQRNIQVYNNRLINTGNNGIGVSSESGGINDGVRIYNNIITGAAVGIRIPEYNDGTVSYIKMLKYSTTTFRVTVVLLSAVEEVSGLVNIQIVIFNGLTVRNNIISQNYQYQLMNTPNSEQCKYCVRQ